MIAIVLTYYITYIATILFNSQGPAAALNNQSSHDIMICSAPVLPFGALKRKGYLVLGLLAGEKPVVGATRHYHVVAIYTSFW